METTESSLVTFDMQLTSFYSPAPLYCLDSEHDQVLSRVDIYSHDVGYSCDPFELEDYSCFAPILKSNSSLAIDGLECLYPKRQRKGCVVQFPESPLPPVGLPAEELLPLPNECHYGSGCTCENRGIGSKQQSTVRPSLSAQGVAAQERRRKITEKTTELGRLIPGCRKMTTAEMLYAAHKYIKFLQAQVGVLQLIYPNDKYQPCVTAFIRSSRVQEKLYSEEKCLATKDLVLSIMRSDEIRSREGMI